MEHDVRLTLGLQNVPSSFKKGVWHQICGLFNRINPACKRSAAALFLARRALVGRSKRGLKSKDQAATCSPGHSLQQAHRPAVLIPGMPSGPGGLLGQSGLTSSRILRPFRVSAGHPLLCTPPPRIQTSPESPRPKIQWSCKKNP